MAKKDKIISIEKTLWDSANKLRGTVEPSEYKHVVLSLIFLKCTSDKFEERRNELKAEGKDNAKQPDIALKIDTALFTVEKSNPIIFSHVYP